MSEFEKWFRSLNANGKTVYFLGNEHKVSEMAWNHQQATIDDLKAKLSEVQRVIDIYEDGDIDSLSDFARYVKQALRGAND